MARVMSARTPVGSVLDLDPDLGWGISGEDWPTARSVCRGEVVRVPSRRWVVPDGADERQELVGLVIVTGLVCRELALRDRHMLELLGPGDVVQLPVDCAADRVGSDIQLTVALDSELIALGRAFIGAAARWPCLLANLHDRLETQRANLAVQGLIGHLPRAEHRLLLILRHLADRWGYVTGDGTVLPLPLSHDLLAQLAGARRPTITLAVGALEDAGALARTDDGSWLLTPAADQRIHAISTTSPSSRTLGEIFSLTLRTHATHEDARALQFEARLARSRPAATAHRGGHWRHG